MTYFSVLVFTNGTLTSWPARLKAAAAAADLASKEAVMGVGLWEESGWAVDDEPNFDG